MSPCLPAPSSTVSCDAEPEARAKAITLMRRVLTLLVLLALAGGGAYWWFEVRPHSAGTSQTAASGGRGGGRRGADPNQPIPVVVQAAETREVPIYLDGLGTAQASATVTVHVQVDGVLQEVRFKEGQDVHVGDVLAKIDPRLYQAALDQAVAKKAQDQANLANARIDLTRYQKLAATAYTSAQQADTQKATVAQLEAQVQQDQAQVDTARTNLSYTTIASPVDGRIGIRQVDAGNIVHTSDANGLCVITTLQPIAVIFTLPQQSLPMVSVAMGAGQAGGGQPEVLALLQGNDANVLDHGKLSVVDNQVDQTTGTIKLKAYFPNPKLQIWPGAFLTMRLRVDTKTDATVVPPVAVQRGPTGPFVYVVDAGDTVTRRPVKVGHEDQTASIIEDGVKPGDQVVIDGASRLTDHAKVAIVQPAGAAPAATPPPAAPGEHRRRSKDETPGTASRARDRGNS